MDRKRRIGLICALWIVGVLFVLLKGKWMDGLLKPQGLGLDVCTIIIAYLFSEISRNWAVAFSLSQGLLTDIYSGGLRGLFAALYLAVYGIIHLGSRFLDLNGVKGQMVIVAVAVFVKYCLFFPYLEIISSGAFHRTSCPVDGWFVFGGQRSGGPLCVRAHPVVWACAERRKRWVRVLTGFGNVAKNPLLPAKRFFCF